MRTQIRTAQQKIYSSGYQAIVSGAPLIWAHGLGVRPNIVQCWLKCVTDENGFIAGQITPLVGASLGNNQGVSLIVDEINLIVRYGSKPQVFTIVNASNGNTADLTNSHWNFMAEVYP